MKRSNVQRAASWWPDCVRAGLSGRRRRGILMLKMLLMPFFAGFVYAPCFVMAQDAEPGAGHQAQDPPASDSGVVFTFLLPGDIAGKAESEHVAAEAPSQQYVIPDPQTWLRIFELDPVEKFENATFENIADMMRQVYGLQCDHKEGEWVVTLPPVPPAQQWILCKETSCGIESVELKNGGADFVWNILINYTTKHERDCLAYFRSYREALLVVSVKNTLASISTLGPSVDCVTIFRTHGNIMVSQALYESILRCIRQ